MKEINREMLHLDQSYNSFNKCISANEIQQARYLIEEVVNSSQRILDMLIDKNKTKPSCYYDQSKHELIPLGESDYCIMCESYFEREEWN